MTQAIIADKMNKLYKTINKYYKTINREMLKQIVKRADEITDLYYDYVYHNMNDKQKQQNEKTLLTKRILNNEKCEVCTFDAVLTFICGIYHFLWALDNEPNKIFQHSNIWYFMHCAVHKFDMKNKFMFLFNDENITETAERFLNIDDYEIMELLKLNFN